MARLDKNCFVILEYYYDIDHDRYVPNAFVKSYWADKKDKNNFDTKLVVCLDIRNAKCFKNMKDCEGMAKLMAEKQNNYGHYYWSPIRIKDINPDLLRKWSELERQQKAIEKKALRMAGRTR